METPLVSLVLNNYNYGPLLAAAIDSALAQTYPRTEVVVVDDGSTDGSRAIIATYGDRIRAILQPNGGQAAAFNAGFAASRGDIVCLLDSDDISYPQRADRVAAAFQRWPRADWLRHQLAIVDVGGRPVGPIVPDFDEAGPVEPVALRFIEGRVPALTSGLAFRRAFGDRVFPLPTRVEVPGGGVSLARDADAYLRCGLAAAGGWYASLAEVLGAYRRHPSQQFTGYADLAPMLRRQNEVALAAATAFAGTGLAPPEPTTVFKHRAVLAAFAGAGLVSRERLGVAIRGWRRAALLVPVSPLLALRQALALGAALLMPRRWADRVLRNQGFTRAS